MTAMPAMVEKLDSIASVASVKAMILDPLKENLEEMDKFQQMAEQTIDLDEANHGEYLVNSEFDDELKGLHVLIYFIIILVIIF